MTKPKSGGDQPALKPDKPAEPRSDVTAGGGDAPFVIFDGVLAYNIFDGTARLTLAAIRGLPTGTGSPRFDYVTTCYLRGGLSAVVELRDALNNILLLAAPTDGQSQ